MSIFAHMGENFVGVVPNVAIFCHYFIPRIEGSLRQRHLDPRSSTKEIYPEDNLHLKWNEWRADWCWIKEDNFPDLCKPRRKKVGRDKDWSYLDARDKDWSYLDAVTPR